MRIRLASILALLVCFVFTATQNAFAVGEFDNFRQANAFRFNIEPNTGFRVNDRINVGFGNCGFAKPEANNSKNFDAFRGSNFDKFNNTGNNRSNSVDLSTGLQFQFR